MPVTEHITCPWFFDQILPNKVPLSLQTDKNY